jgi:NAD(P)H-quinone oxidoreductase subunit 5
MQGGLGLVLIPMLIGVGLLLFPTATINLCRMWTFPSILLLSIVMIFSANFFIQQINNSYIYQYVGLGPSIMIFR